MLDLLNKQDVYLACYCLDILSKYLYMFLINYLDTGTPVLRGLERSLWYTIACLYPVIRVSGNRVIVETHVNIA